MNSPTAPLIYVVDDDEAFRNSLGWMLRAAGYRVTEWAMAEHFLAAHEPRAAACLILDIRMPGMTGLELQKELLRREEYVPTIFVTAHGDISMAVRAVKQGAFDFIEKPFNGKALLALIERAVRSGALRVATAAQQLAVDERVGALSSREHEVMTRVLEGKTNKAIANDLGISVKTVECHRARMMEKIGAGSIAELVRLVANRHTVAEPE
jgi:FixJ family two-component response regulator